MSENIIILIEFERDTQKGREGEKEREKQPSHAKNSSIALFKVEYKHRKECTRMNDGINTSKIKEKLAHQPKWEKI